MLRFKLLFDQKLDKRVEQGLPSLARVMNKFEKPKIKGERGTIIPYKNVDDQVKGTTPFPSAATF